ncbi:MAG: hypothetical protein OSB29_06840 [Verrucomicrobiota bacterium]|nr:hypothetical protein [Verrucomicrobiota bacterium]
MRSLISSSWILALFSSFLIAGNTHAAALLGGAAKVDITDERGPVNDRLYVRALVLKSGDTTAVLVTIDAVAIGGIGRIKDDFLPNVRAKLQKELGIAPGNTLFNASHCHGLVHPEVEARTIAAVKTAIKNLVPVKAGAGMGRETRIMENRRLVLKSGKVVDVRHAYSLPPDELVAAVGPVDTEIGVLRLDRLDGKPLAIVYNFACHPIQNVPSGGNTADITGFSSKTIEENLGKDCIALFVQGCGGDINPINYKAVNHLRNAEPLGLMLGLSTLRAVRKIKSQPGQPMVVHSEKLKLPRADHAKRIAAMEAERKTLSDSLNGTFLNLNTFLPLAAKYNLSPDFPSLNSYRYLHERKMGRAGLDKLDATNRANLRAYVRNIHTMEQITRLNTNLRLLKRHHATGHAVGNKTIDVEVAGLRVGEFVLVTFPGELTVQIGLNIKKISPHDLTFVAGYTNGYIYYAPTAKQLRNAGGAQEDSDCLLDPAWQKLYETRAAALIQRLK